MPWLTGHPLTIPFSSPCEDRTTSTRDGTPKQLSLPRLPFPVCVLRCAQSISGRSNRKEVSVRRG
ncbi:hypothetical protein Taro_029822 [Colocasia esculenta]|uniref:Uncharacterized protein n=1 Tax=Colocasia esculenta TaxID=4460 RepID=A0A843VJX3_COLES|nr:hypothetical protein [Colocasia esculenta]